MARRHRRIKLRNNSGFPRDEVFAERWNPGLAQSRDAMNRGIQIRNTKQKSGGKPGGNWDNPNAFGG